MAWSYEQKNRLGVEKQLLDKYFKDRVTWNNPTSFDANVEIKMTSNSDRSYILRVYLEHDFPNSCPQMVLVSPENPLLRNGDPLPIVSSVFHTIGMRGDGYIKLCHFIPEEWTNDNTLFQVFMKGRLWIEAYEGHLDTSKNIDEYLKHQSEEQFMREELPQEQMPEEELRMPEGELRGNRRKKCVVM